MVTTDNCWAHTGLSLPFTPSFSCRFHVPLALNNIKRYQALSLSRTHTHISTFQIYKSTPEGKRTKAGRLTIHPRHRQSITRPFSYLVSPILGVRRQKKRRLLLFQSFHRFLLKMRCVQCALFIVYYKNLRFWSQTKIKWVQIVESLFSLIASCWITRTHAQY